MIAQLFVCLALLGWDEPRIRPDLVGTFDARLVPEASGVVRGRRNPDLFWVHNDSGNAPQIFAVDRNGQVRRSFVVAAPNLDWEDVAIDEKGRLYIGDIGDNLGVLRIRTIYRIDEPDLNAPEADPLPITAATFYARPASDCFDAEGFVIDGDRAILVVKRRDGEEAELREVPVSPPASLLRPAVAKQVGVLPGFVEPATGADLSRDGLRLAVCGVDVVRVYERPAPPSWDDLRLLAEVPLVGGLHIEGIAWDEEDDLVLVGEGRGLDRISAEVWKAHETQPRAIPAR